MKLRREARTCPQCKHRFFIHGAKQCPECGLVMETAKRRPRLPRFLSVPEMRYQNAYVWLVLVSALDIMLTMLVLYAWKGVEVNPIAAAILKQMGFVWLIIFKFATVVFVVVICEVIGRKKDRMGRTLAYAAVFINALPVAYTFVLLSRSGPAPAVAAASVV